MTKEKEQKIMIDQQFRLEALGSAVRHRLSSESPADIVKAAEKYLAFLQGTSN